ncbi:hypothetical protein Egran_06832 [Elaphomyces granulatus]|uniref:Uncharacterized protein n=1 Tax=Elaphomyces granulatus TaxID=519963 RepID=A0A232LML6_9EURO|nr:hypothetical protein Egran_06832 [Elaphomyces granulatus]
MDSPEDRDIKLQRASGDLLKELETKLPPLLSKPSSWQDIRVPHRWAQVSKINRIIDLLEPFQEWPQLLDPRLQNVLPPLIDAFLIYLTKHREQYGSRYESFEGVASIYPLPRAICKILYVLCKVRGVKVISRFLNNEPRYLELMLNAFIEWDSGAVGNKPALIWEERYVMLMWLSHLLLAPFDLASISTDNIPIPYDNLVVLHLIPPETPRITQSLLSLCLKFIVVPGKEREAATILLARLILRPDMQRLGLLRILIEHAFSLTEPSLEINQPNIYTCIGALSFLARLGTSSQVEDLAPLATIIFDQSLQIAQGESSVFQVIRSSALARKLIIKILRSIVVLVLSIGTRRGDIISDYKQSSILEDSIDYFLVALADQDTQVRFAASKALSIVTLNLDPGMAADVVEAVIGSLDENILYQKPDGTLLTQFEARGLDVKLTKRNLSAVDAQRWQGLILTLAHLLFRRAPPPRQLPELLQSLVSGLDFEQRSSTGSSVGSGVRDASCFGIWSLSRKYTTEELQALDMRSVKLPIEYYGGGVLQILAVQLVCAACVDPSGNIRRGASAALQELIGRHPNTILEGISLVQTVDYHAVARRSRAMIDVSKGAASLGEVYWNSLVDSLMYWRGVGSPDAESRRLAATALGELSIQRSYKTIGIVIQRLSERLSNLPRNDIETKHGCLLAIASTVVALIHHQSNTIQTQNQTEIYEVITQVSKLWEIFHSSFGPTKEDLTLQTARPEFAAEASSRLISSLSLSVVTYPAVRPSVLLLEKALEILLLCVFRGEDIAIEASSEAASNLFRLLPLSKQAETVQGWFANIHASWKSATGRGQISALGAVFHCFPMNSDARTLILDELLRCTAEEEAIDKRVAAVKSLTVGVLPYIDVSENSIVEHFIRFLDDYTTDRRGDIGSLIRIEAIQAVHTILEKSYSSCQLRSMHDLVACLCRLAAEKLDKVRFQAWLCLQNFWLSSIEFPPLQRKYEHFSQVSSSNYFLQLLGLLQIEWIRVPLIQGIAASAVAGTEGLVRASRSAIAEYINMQEAGEEEHKFRLFIDNLIIILENNLFDDRYAIPAIELSGFLLDSYGSLATVVLEKSLRRLFVLVQKAHYKSSNIPRLEAAIKVYASLSRIPSLRVESIKKLISMLLHPYPKLWRQDLRLLCLKIGLLHRSN